MSQATDVDMPQQLYKQLFEQNKYYEAQQLLMTQITRKSSIPLALEAIHAFLECNSPNKIELASSLGSFMIEIANKNIQTVEASTSEQTEFGFMHNPQELLEAVIQACQSFPDDSLKTSNNSKVFFYQAIEFSIKHAADFSPHGHPLIQGAYAKMLSFAEQHAEAQHAWAVSRQYDDHIVTATSAIESMGEFSTMTDTSEPDQVVELDSDSTKVNETSRLIIRAVLEYLALEDLNGANLFFDALGHHATLNTQSFLLCTLRLAAKSGNECKKYWKTLLSTFSSSLLTEKVDEKSEKTKWKLEEVAADVGVALWKIAPAKSMLDSILDATSMFQGLDIGSLLKGMGGMGGRS